MKQVKLSRLVCVMLVSCLSVPIKSMSKNNIQQNTNRFAELAISEEGSAEDSLFNDLRSDSASHKSVHHILSPCVSAKESGSKTLQEHRQALESDVDDFDELPASFERYRQLGKLGIEASSALQLLFFESGQKSFVRFCDELRKNESKWKEKRGKK